MTLARTSLRILFLVSAHDSLSQRAYIALTELGHEVSIAVVDSASAMERAVARKIHAAEGHPGVLDALGARSSICSQSTKRERSLAAPASSSLSATAHLSSDRRRRGTGIWGASTGRSTGPILLPAGSGPTWLPDSRARRSSRWGTRRAVEVRLRGVSRRGDGPLTPMLLRPDRSHHEARRHFVYKLGSAAPSVPRRESRAA
jgi:hypothetical protein